MFELVSSDETSTIETTSPDTTLILNTSKCIVCDKILGYQGKFSSDIKYHYFCLEAKPCVFCGLSGIKVFCQYKGCLNAFHKFCLSRYCPKQNIDSLNCGLHSEKKADKLLYSFRKIANTIQQEEFKLNEYKYLKGEIKSSFFSHGQIF